MSNDGKKGVADRRSKGKGKYLASGLQCTKCDAPTPSPAARRESPMCETCFRNNWTKPERREFYDMRHPLCGLCGDRTVRGFCSNSCDE